MNIKGAILNLIFLSLFLNSSFCGEEVKLNMYYENATYARVLHAIARQTGRQVCLDVSFPEYLQTTVDYEKVSAVEALNQITREMARVYNESHLDPNSSDDMKVVVRWEIVILKEKEYIMVYVIYPSRDDKKSARPFGSQDTKSE